MLKKQDNIFEKPGIIYLRELKLRVVYCFIIWFILFISSYIYYNEVFEFLLNPLLNKNLLLGDFKLIFSSLLSIFFTKLVVAFIFSFFLVLPYLVLQYNIFCLSAKYYFEQKYLIINSLGILCLFEGLFFLSYLKFIPLVFEFLLSEYLKLGGANNNGVFINYRVDLYLVIDKYLLLIFNLMLIFITFLFVIIVLHINFYIFNYLTKKIYFYLLLIIISLLTPPDLVSLLFIILPIYCYIEINSFSYILNNLYLKWKVN